MTEVMQIGVQGREAKRYESKEQNFNEAGKVKMADKENVKNEKRLKNVKYATEDHIIEEDNKSKDVGGQKNVTEKRRKSLEGGSKSEGLRRGSLARPQIKIPYLAQIERRISMDILDYSGKMEGLRLIREVNKETSHYRHLAVALGGSSDCEQLRDDLRKSRQRAADLVKQAKNKIMPILQEPNKFTASDRKEARRLCKLLFYCINVLEQEIMHALTLENSFVLQTGNINLINTGVHEYLTSHKTSPSAVSSEEAIKQRIQSEKGEIIALQKEAAEIRCYLHKNDGSPGVKSWTMEDFGERQFLQTIMEDDPSSVSSPASPFLHIETGASDQESIGGSLREKLHHRRCLCVIFASMLIVLLVASLIGTLIAFLYS